ncbi:ABC transporter substrate-binding protein [Salipaludibacillus aurantiacus]|uniref:Cellobiose transport system substrate-binding protein n=1 Tax=Salipaludibacillus aurantiacus TaxID=1601833 RepID=A0A1H9V205_9BACI|nr:extracellular solute-binding protein [Salipaludibacillus aurantiacus]SES15746.1 cellobiose transport system substrate-binding protein [Salipaludibacillus aurantiacus]
MKKYGLMAALLALSVAAAGCGDNNTNDTAGNTNDNTNDNDAALADNEDVNEDDVTSLGDEDADVELSFWLFGATGYPELAEEYIEENPNVSITFQEIEMGDHHNNLFTALSAGSGAPDLAAIEVSELDSYKSAEDRFVNLYDFGAEELEDDYLDWVWENGESVEGDFLFGLPTDIGPTVMFYRTDVFEEAGLPSEPEEVEELISTWDDYREVAQTILDETGKPMADNPETVFNAKRDQAPQAYFNENDELILDDEPYVREAFFETSEMIQDGYVDNFGMWTPEWGGGMADGDFATLLAPAWMQGVIKGNAPDATEWRVAAMPEGGGNWGGSYVAIPEQSELQQEAYDFMTWLLAPEQQLKAFENMGLFPSTPEVYDMPEFQDYSDDYFGGQNTAQVFAQSALEGEHVHKGPQYGDVNSEILAGLDNVFDGFDPEEEWEDVLSRVEQRTSR